MLLQWGVGPLPYPVQDEGLGLETSPGGEACPNRALCSLGRQRACLFWWASCSFCSPREMGMLAASPGRDLVAPLGSPSGPQPWNLMLASSPHGSPLAPGNTVHLHTDKSWERVPPPSPWSSHFLWRGCQKLLDFPGGPNCAHGGRASSWRGLLKSNSDASLFEERGEGWGWECLSTHSVSRIFSSSPI